VQPPGGILFDLDGVVYNGEEPIPGAAEALAWVRGRGLPHLFLSNTTSRPRQALVEKLGRFGAPVEREQIWTPPTAAAEYLRGCGGPAALFVPAATCSEFEGLELAPEDAESGAAAVVIGDLGERWDFHTLNRAFRLMHSNRDAQLIALGMTRFWRSPTGPSLDVAPFVAALEHAADRRAVVLGKPAKAFFEAAARRLGIAPERLWMLGDDIRADIGGAQRAGLRAALVKTGKFRPLDLEGEIQPDLVLESIADIGRLFGG
jgi:HAD superfamily hydrolase (TIGR01458 family)